MVDFTLSVYKDLLQALSSHGYAFCTFEDYSAGRITHSKHLLLRHDVDRMPARSLQLARMEADQGVVSTYFFRTKPVSFSPRLMSEIKSMGHEIGYHYENLSDTRGDIEKAWDDFKINLRLFEKHDHQIKSIAMHGRPLSPWDNRLLWQHKNYRELGVDLEAYLDIDYSRYVYYTDVGRRWDGKGNKRDRVPTMDVSARTTQEMLKAIQRQGASQVIISTHPERWSSHPLGWSQVLLTDMMINGIKSLLSRGGK